MCHEAETFFTIESGGLLPSHLTTTFYANDPSGELKCAVDTLLEKKIPAHKNV